MKIGFVGGGTGGHFYPLIATAEKIKRSEYNPELYYFGPSPYDPDELEKLGIKYIYCPAGKLRRYFSMQNILDIFRNFFGVFVAIWKLYIIYPDVIFSKGGYTSVPILIAAKFLRIPVVIHESDAVVGRANKLATKQARYIAISYDDTISYFPKEKTALTGIPLREEILQPPADPFSFLGIPNDKPLIYITGGSTGAERLNNLIIRCLTELLPNYRIIHQTGQSKVADFKLSIQSLLGNSPLQNDYYVDGTLNTATVAAVISAASLVITRAGSTTLFEIAAHGKPSIIVPIPEDISRDQRSNAYAFARSGAATVIEEHNLTPHLLIQEINNIMNNPDNYSKMASSAKAMYIEGASEKIANIILSIGIEHGS